LGRPIVRLFSLLVWITTDKSFRFHNNRLDEMPGKLDSTERSFNKFPTPSETSGWPRRRSYLIFHEDSSKQHFFSSWPLAKDDIQWGHMSGESMTTSVLEYSSHNTVPTLEAFFPQIKYKSLCDWCTYYVTYVLAAISTRITSSDWICWKVFDQKKDVEKSKKKCHKRKHGFNSGNQKRNIFNLRHARRVQKNQIQKALVFAVWVHCHSLIFLCFLSYESDQTISNPFVEEIQEIEHFWMVKSRSNNKCWRI